jgi:hypothetical protein
VQKRRGEEAIGADATAFCTTAASTRSKLYPPQRQKCLLREKLLLQLLLQLHAAHGCNNHANKKLIQNKE